MQFLHKTLKLMLMYSPAEFGWKKISRSANMIEAVISDYMSLHSDLDLEDSKPIFLHDILAHVDASPNQVRLLKVKRLRRYCPNEHSLQF